MAGQIGRSTSAQTAKTRHDVPGAEPASFRYNNPGAQYPSPDAAAFGQIGYGVIGPEKNLIACFTSPVNGAAANFDLLDRGYVGLTLGAAGTKWTGAHGFGVPGYDPNIVLTRAVLDDPRQAIALLKAIAGRESGRGSNLTEEQWRQAHAMFKAGSSDAYLKNLRADPLADIQLGAKTGEGLVKRARAHIGESYRNVQVPKDDPNWTGPWDCAEFASWLVFQEAQIPYGWIDDQARPAKADAYTGAWKSDVARLGRRVSVAEAAATVGGIVLRYPPAPGAMGHIAVCDGQGGTIEAKGRRYGVVADTVHGRSWDTGVLIPGITYGAAGTIEVSPPVDVYKIGAPNMSRDIVTRIQRALAAKGFDSQGIDGEYGPDTQAAVVAFQTTEGLTIDGEIGPETASALGISLRAEDAAPLRETPSGGLPGPLSPPGIVTQPVKDGGAFMPPPGQNQVDLLQKVAQILQSLRQTGAGATTSPATDPQIEQLRQLLGILTPLVNPGAKPSEAPLGQVNGALGDTIGQLLNGKKTAIGLIGGLLTQVLGNPGLSSQLFANGALIPGLQPYLLPIFIVMTIWGVLGKAEKWSRGPGPQK